MMYLDNEAKKKTVKKVSFLRVFSKNLTKSKVKRRQKKM